MLSLVRGVVHLSVLQGLSTSPRKMYEFSFQASVLPTSERQQWYGTRLQESRFIMPLVRVFFFLPPSHRNVHRHTNTHQTQTHTCMHSCMHTIHRHIHTQCACMHDACTYTRTHAHTHIHTCLLYTSDAADES